MRHRPVSDLFSWFALPVTEGPGHVPSPKPVAGRPTRPCQAPISPFPQACILPPQVRSPIFHNPLFFLKKYVFLYYFCESDLGFEHWSTFGCPGSALRVGSPSCRSRLFSGCGVQPSHRGGSSRCGTPSLEHAGFSSCSSWAW